MPNIIDKDSAETITTIYGSTDFSSEENCPWVQIGNLYVSATTTGNKSWAPIVRHEHGKGKTAFSILSGRHGDQFGQAVDLKTGAFSDGVADPAHFAEDLKEKDALGLGVDLEVINAGVAPYNTVQGLKSLGQSKIANRVVIFAWCFSLLSMKEYPSNAGIPTKAINSNKVLACNTAVKQLVAENFQWAL